MYAVHAGRNRKQEVYPARLHKILQTILLQLFFATVSSNNSFSENGPRSKITIAALIEKCL